MSLSSAVNPSGDPYAGGTLARAGNPTAVGGSFTSAGAPGFPTPGQPGILSARNNSGSNVRIPYARLVPMRNDSEPMSHAPPEYGDHRWPGARPLRNEYDGLESGELAWILGRRFLATDGGGYGADNDSFARDPADKDTTHQGADGAHPANTRAVDMTRDSAHGMGIGYGPDRMQRLAYTDWMESFYPRTFGAFVIDLAKTPVADNTSVYLSSEIQKYAPVLAGASLTQAIDVPQVYDALFKISTTPAPGRAPAFDGQSAAFRGTVAAAEYTVAGRDDAAVAARNTAVPRGGSDLGAGNAAGLQAGLFFMDRGPFLRGKIVDDARRTVHDGTGLSVGLGYSDVSHYGDGADHISSADTLKGTDMPINLGDDLAFDSLYAHMKALSMFDWTPDGMVLSKLESPSGDPLGSAELDARQAMLFNVAVQGPAIAKTWTGDSKMQTMPMDKVFVVLCADIVWKTGGADAGPGFKEQGADDGLWQTFTKAAADVGSRKKKAAAVKDALKDKVETARAALPTPSGQTASASLAADHAEYAGAFESRRTRSRRLVGASGAEVRRGGSATYGRGGQNLQVDYETADAEMKDQMKWPRDARPAEAAWDALAEDVRTGAAAIENAYMTNFHLRRVTSSFLCSASAHDPGNRNSRCGMALGTAGGAAVAQGVAMGGQFIIGGWCVGTVLDNSASRAAIGHQVRSAPSSMAININVGVEWWSGDRLHRAYMDDSVRSRNDAIPADREALHSVGFESPAYRRRELSARKRDKAGA